MFLRKLMDLSHARECVTVYFNCILAENQTDLQDAGYYFGDMKQPPGGTISGTMEGTVKDSNVRPESLVSSSFVSDVTISPVANQVQARVSSRDSRTGLSRLAPW